MIWVIASIPFWIIAGMLTSISVYGLTRLNKQPNSAEFGHLLGGCLIILAIAGAIALIAAKICS